MRFIYVCTIEGIGESKVGGAGEVRFCYPALPVYATSAYNTGLAEPPRGASGEFDVMKTRVSAGRFTVIIRPSIGPVNFQISNPAARTMLSAAVDDSAAPFLLMQGSSVHGFAVGDVVYIERESCLVTGVEDTPGLEYITVTRGYAGSTARSHPLNAELFAVPPAMTGREVSVYEVDTSAVTAASSPAAVENLVLRGYIGGEVAAGLHWPTFRVVSEFHEAELNAEPNPAPVLMSSTITDEGVPLWFFLEGTDEAVRDDDDAALAPRFVTGGGYWYIDSLGAIFKSDGAPSLDSSGDFYRWVLNGTPVASPVDWSKSIPEGGFSLVDGRGVAVDAYQIAYADIDILDGFPPFVDENRDPSDHPIDICLCLLTSRDGSAAANGSHDLGSSWPSDCAVGIAVGDIDVAGALKMKRMMPNIRAAHFWIGPKSEKLTAALRRLLGIWGIGVGRSIDGRIVLLRMRDIYSSDDVVAITSRDLVQPEKWRQYAKGRALDSVKIKPGYLPDGSTGQPVTIRELTGARFYPNQFGCLVGASETWDRSPYKNLDFAIKTSSAYLLVATRIRRLASRLAMFEITTGPELFGSLDLGDSVTLHDAAIRDPSTGDRLGDGDAALKGLVLSIKPDFSRRVTGITMALTGTGKVGIIAPAATLASWAEGGGVYTATTNADDFSLDDDDDADSFSVNDVVELLNADLTMKGSTTQLVKTISGVSIGLNGNFGVSPGAGDIIVFANYDDSAAAQTADHAYLADGGHRGANPTVGAASDPPYIFGDF